MKPVFLEAVEDPNLIPGVYNYCDQWCAYCPVSSRCLAYRCLSDRRDRQPGDIYLEVATRLFEAVDFACEAGAAAAEPTPALDSLRARLERNRITAPRIDDPLERLGRQYAIQASRFLHSAGDDAAPEPSDAPRPTPLEVVGWFHTLIAAKIYRALVSAASHGETRTHTDDPCGSVWIRGQDAEGSAKVALIGLDRSRTALRELARTDDDPRIEHLVTVLDQLAAALERRFPTARAFVRPGLDGPPELTPRAVP
jgi:hypothetical protein